MEVPPPAASWFQRRASQPACRQLHRSNLPSSPHLAGTPLLITESRGSLLTAKALASHSDTLCCRTQPTGDSLPTSLPQTSTAGQQLVSKVRAVPTILYFIKTQLKLMLTFIITKLGSLCPNVKCFNKRMKYKQIKT